MNSSVQNIRSIHIIRVNGTKSLFTLPARLFLVFLLLLACGLTAKSQTATIAVSNPSSVCVGATQPVITFTGSGGTAEYYFNYTLDNGTTQSTLTTPAASIGGVFTLNVPTTVAGTYVYTLTSFREASTTNEFPVTGQSVTVIVNAIPVVTIDITASLCSGQNALLTSNATAGSGSISSYQWNFNGSPISGATSSTLTITTAGDYTVTVTNTNNCATTSAITTVVENTLPQVSISQTNVLCFGGSTGSIDLTVTGGVAPYTYLWSNSATAKDLTGLTAGTYTVTITDANGCVATASQTITEPTALTATSSHTDVLCNGGATGTMTAAGTNGIAPYSYVIAGPTVNTTGATSGVFTGLSDGTYTITVTDANGCTTTTSQTITEPAALNATSSHTNVLCNGGATGTITATGANGTSPYTYVIAGPTVNTTGAASGVFTGLSDGNYTITVTDANGCTTTTSQTITEPATLTTTSSHTNVLCNGGATGTMTAIGANGTAPYTYVIAGPTVNTTGATSGIFTGLTDGSYTITVTDANGCTTNASQTITEPAVLIATSSHTNVFCNGGATGTMTAAGANGTPPYSYVIAGPTVNTTGASSGLFTGLTDGNYTITVTDVNGCATTTSQTITEPTALNATSSHTNVLCNSGATGTMTAAGTNGTSPYTYVIAGPTVNTSGATSGIFTGLSDGTYTITVTDANGCTTTTSQTITEPAALTATSSHTNVLCNGGATGTMTAAGTNGTSPYSYVIAGPVVNTTGATSGIFTGLSDGAYTITVTDANGCTTTTSQTITEPATLTATSSHTNVLCNGGATGTMTAAGTNGTAPYSYVIAGPTVNTTGATSGIFTGLTDGTYTITVTDANGCTTTSSQTITEPTALTATSSHTNVLCNSGATGTMTAAGANGTAPYSYVIAGPTVNTTGAASGIFTGLGNGAYTITVTDANGCTTTTSQTITQPSSLTATSSHTNVLCNGGATGTMTGAGVAGTAPYSYVIAGPTVNTTGATSGIFTGLAAGNYTITVTDANGCTTTTSQIIAEPATLTATSSHTNVLCNGGATGTMTATGANGTSTYSYVIAGPVVNTTGATSGIFTGLTDGAYTITVTDANGCTTTTSQTITEPATLTATSSHTNVLCNGGATGTMTAAGVAGTAPYSYVIAGPTVNTTGATSGTFTGLTDGAYTITVTDANGCTNTTSQTITEPTALTATSSHTNVLCNSGATGTMIAAGANGTAPYSYVIEGPTVNTTGAASGVFTGLTNGTYTITVTDANGCTTTTSQTITQPSSLTATSSHTNVLCNGGTTGTMTAAGVAGTAPYSYVIAGPVVNTTGVASGVFTGLSAGSYTVTVTDVNGCTTTTSQTVTEPTAINISVTSSNSPVCAGNTLNLIATASGGTGTLTYSWSGPNGFTSNLQNPSITNVTAAAAGTYTVTVTDANGCSATSTTTVTVNPLPTATITMGGPVIFCNGSSVTLTASAGVSWLWSNGETTQTITVTTSGSYSVTVTDANGCTSPQSAATDVTVNPLPTATTSVSGPTTFCSGGSVTLTASAGASWLWSTGATTQAITVTTTGSYTVTVTDGNGCSRTSPPRTVTVHPLPTITLGANPSVCRGTTPANLTYSATTGSPNQYSIAYDPTAIAAGFANITNAVLPVNQIGLPVPVAAAPGTYNAVLTIRNSTTTCISSYPISITVNPIPTVTVNSAAKCVADPAVTITATPSPAGTYNYVWTVPGGAINPGNVASFPATVAGTYSVIITNPATGCSGSGAATLTVHPNPAVTVNVNPAVICSTDPAAIISTVANPSGVYNYAWTVPAGATNPGNVSNFPATVTGTYDVVITSPTTGCTGTGSGTLTVNPAPVVDPVSNQTVCNGASTTAITFSGTGTSYTWTNNTPGIGLAASGTGNIAAFTAVNTGSSPVTATITVTPHYTNLSVTCNGPTQTFTITVNPTPAGSAAPQTICSSATTNVVLNSTVTGTTFTWTAAMQTTPAGGTITGFGSGSGSPIAQTLINTGTTAGVIRYTVTPTANGCAGPTFTADVTVNPTPVGSATPQTICSGATSNVAPNSTVTGTTFTWTGAIQTTPTGGTITGFGSGSGSPIAQTLINTGTTAGVIRYTVTPTANSCPGSTFTVDVTINPAPVGSATPQTICSGETSSVPLNSTVTGTTFTWTAAIQTTPAGGTITGFGSGSGTAIAQTLANTGTTAGIIRYTVTPTANACAGPTFTVDVTVNPAPVGSAAPQAICNGATSNVALNSTVTGTTFTWTAAIQTTPAGGTITGFGSGSGSPIAETLINTGTTSGVIRYTVTPTANGCTGSPFTVDVTVRPTPVGSAVPQIICSRSTTNVALTSTVTGTTFTWTAAIQTTPTGGTITGFANGSGLAIAQTLTNTGTTAGVIRYTVTPTANSCAGVAFTVDVTIDPEPVGSATPQAVCSGTTSNVILNSTLGGTTFTWTAAIQTAPAGGTITGFANGSGSAITQTLFNTGTSSGVIRYTVTPTAGGCTGLPFTVDVTVTLTPAGSALPQTICSGATSNVILNSTVPGTTFTWTAAIQTAPSGGTITGFADGSGSPIAQTLTNTGTTGGVIRYTVIPTANGCTGAAFTVDVTVNPRPVGSALPQTICSATATSVALSSTLGSTTFAWTAAIQTAPAGGTITGAASGSGATIAQTLTNTGTTAGIIRYSVTPTTNGCAGSVFTVDVTVNPRPVGSASPQTICSGTASNVALNSTVTGTTFTWTAAIQTTPPGGTITGFSNCASTCGTTIAQTLVNTGTGNGVIRYTVTPTANGCPGTPFTVDVTVVTAPTIANAGPDLTICAATPSGTLAANNPTAGTGAWTIVSGPNTNTSQLSSTTSPTATFTAAGGPGTYVLNWTISKANCTTSVDEVIVTVNQPPSVTVITDFCALPGKVVLTASPAFASYQWALNGAPIAGATTQSITVDIAGIYSVNVTDAFGCTGFGSNSVSNDLVVNGSFTNGNTGFTTGYQYYADGAGNNELVPDNANNGYGVGTNGQNYHPNFWGRDHTNNTVGPRNFMLVNGHGTIVVWSQTITVQPNTNYYFAAWAMSLNSVGPFANLQFSVNGTLVGTTAALAPHGQTNASPDNWIRFYGVWNSGAVSGPITISIVDLENSAGGNDFGIDDISFGTLDQLPVDAAPTAGVNGIVCLGQTATLIPNITNGKPPITYNWSTVSGPNTPTITSPNDSATTVTGLMVGTYVFQLMVADGYNCAPVVKTTTVTVNPAIDPVSGNFLICQGATTQLTGPPPPAAINPWVSASPSVATVSNTGLVTGISGGSSVITYTNEVGCSVSATVVVDVPTISGGLSVCAGSTTQLAGSGTPAGTNPWVSATPSVATISSTGLVTGITAGTSVITYTNSNGCTATATITVNANPTATGVTICQGGSGSLTSSTICSSVGPTTVGPNIAGTGATSGGAGTGWTGAGNVTADDNTYATVSGTGIAFSEALNTTNFGFAIPANATINGIQVTIGRFRSGTGGTGEIQDNSVRLLKAGAAIGNNNGATATNWPTSEAPANYGTTTDLWGTTWTPAEINANNFGVALVVDNTSGSNSRTANVDYVQIRVTYTIAGVLNWYTVSTGGTVVQTGSPFNPIADPEVLAAGGSYANLANTNTPGTYTFYTECSNVPGCRTAVDFIINPTPAITGTLTVCQGSTTQLTGSGTPLTPVAWTSATPAVATVDNNGLVTAIAGGTSVITYTNSNNCSVTATVTVNPLPVTTGATTCQGGSGQLNVTSPCAGTGGNTVYNSNGTFVVPAGITSITVQAWGAGGGGTNNGGSASGGGGGGAYASRVIAVTPGQSFTVVVGTGGTAGNAGGISYFNTNSLVSTTSVVAAGGGSSTSTAGGAGGSVANSNGTTEFAGGNGGNGSNSTNFGGGGGGGSALTNANGGNGVNGVSNTGGAGGTGTGAGGRGCDNDGSPASQAGVAPGGGGGGRSDDNCSSQSGANGQVIVTYSSSVEIRWYDAATGGNLVFTGNNFNPASLLPGGNTNTPGTYPFWAECSLSPGCRTLTNFVINPNPVVTTTNACIGGGTVTFTQTGAPAGGTWSVSGGGTINASTGELTPTTAGCFTATYTAASTCFNTNSFVVFPAAPVLVSPANACNTAFTLPAVTPVAGFTVQYSINGAAFAATPTIPSTPGCYTIQARYVLTAACGTTSAGSTGSGTCGVSNTVDVVIFPAAPPAPVVNAGCGPIVVTAPAAVAGFTIEYSFDNGTTWGANTPPTADNCTGYQIRTRYVLSVSCGSVVAGTAGTGLCAASPATTRILDQSAPVITTTAGSLDATLECSNAAGLTAALAQVPVATDNCTASPTIHLISDVTTPGSCANAYTRVRTWNFTDPCNNTSVNFTQTITVQDNTAPVITTTTGSLDVTLQCSDAAGLTAALAQVPAATDNCTVSPTIHLISDVTTAGTCANAYTRVRTWNFTDACNNVSASFVQTITVQDNTAPVWTTAADALNRTVECNDAAALAAAQALSPVATDNCGSVFITKTFGSFVPTACGGSYTNTWVAVDVCNNTSTVYTQVITVTDNTAPVWTTTANALNVSVECSNTAGLTAAQALSPVATDNCSGVTYTKTSGAFVAGTCGGTYTNTWIAVDICNNTSAVFTQIITITDLTAPIWATAADALNRTLECGDADGLAAAQSLSPVATDGCSGVTTYTKTTGAFVAATCGGTYTNTWTANDGCGNISTVFTQVITITDTQDPVLTCPPPQTLCIVPTNTYTIPTLVASDNCSSTLTITYRITGATARTGTGINASGLFNLGVSTITWTVRDACGNISTCTTTITISPKPTPIIYHN